MIGLAEIMLVAAGAIAALYVKKVFHSVSGYVSPPKTSAGRSPTLKNGAASASENVLKEAKAAAKPEKGKYRFALATTTMGLAIVARFGMPGFIPITLGLIGYLSGDLFKQAATAIFKEKRMSAETLNATVIILCLLFRQIGLTTFMIWILDLADVLMGKAERESRQYLSAIFSEQPRFAWLLVNDQEIECPVKDLQKGDIIVIAAGDQVPVDGIVTEGKAIADQQSFTGETALVEKCKGDKIFATTILVTGKVKVKVQETGKNTFVAKRIQNYFDKFRSVFIFNMNQAG
ncbi:MAG: hypothetical protein GY862_37155 [Gammaproteobacteria bacterium]|nr:hypothetical protein [Gammaproteobacteria bacterium]